ncbi:hypothetical protein BAE44_0018595 [Dichanthelium oligosanthes]|uniref:Uncharacterized protein n=1 Tax=Dichanthelium oligosanthes TaxID=888268 RepID=A0A1E5V5E5_9POAL|nr:hypothetical protein BAE44_0018595 [Dichanthelium oligosanthes]
MGKYIMRTGSNGFGSILFTSPRITGHRHRSVRSPPPSPAALDAFRNRCRPLQQSLVGVGVSSAAPVRNVPQLMSPARGATHSVPADPALLPLGTGVPAGKGERGAPGQKQGGWKPRGGGAGTRGMGAAGQSVVALPPPGAESAVTPSVPIVRLQSGEGRGGGGEGLQNPRWRLWSKRWASDGCIATTSAAVTATTTASLDDIEASTCSLQLDVGVLCVCKSDATCFVFIHSSLGRSTKECAMIQFLLYCT